MPASGSPVSPPDPSHFWRLASWIVPTVVCLFLYRYGLTAWFQQDDFVWLGLEVHGVRDLLQTLFLPTPHGTLRPWSDRGFFMAMKGIFGLHPLPFHLAVFVIQSANLALLGSLVRRLTRSPVAGFLAPILWVVNPVLVLPMVWISGVYQVMGCFCFLLALRLFVEYAETGAKKYLFWQWGVFLFGLGVIESIIVYPLMAAAFAVFYARTRVKHALVMLVVSIAFVLARLTLAPGQSVGPYAMHVDLSMVSTLLNYWRLAAGEGKGILQGSVAAFVTGALLVFAARQFVNRDYLPLVFLVWFVLPLAPVLPLRDHVTGYYLTIPFLSIAGLGAYAIAHAWETRSALQPWFRAAVIVLAAGYISVSIKAADFAAHWWYARSKRVEHTFNVVRATHDRHPDRVILLADIDNDLFWSCVIYRPFRLAGIRDVYLAPGSDARVTMSAGSPHLSEWMISGPAARKLKAEDRLVVLRLTDAGFVDVTASWSPPVE